MIPCLTNVTRDVEFLLFGLILAIEGWMDARFLEASAALQF